MTFISKMRIIQVLLVTFIGNIKLDDTYSRSATAPRPMVRAKYNNYTQAISDAVRNYQNN